MWGSKMKSIQKVIEEATTCHKQGRLAEAEALYREVLAGDSRQFDALHMLGVIAHQTGKHEDAVQLITRALQRNPADAAAHCNLGTAYRALNRLDEAAGSYRKAIELKPDYPLARRNLSQIHMSRGNIGSGLSALLKVTSFIRFTKSKVNFLLAQTAISILAESAISIISVRAELLDEICSGLCMILV